MFRRTFGKMSLIGITVLLLALSGALAQAPDRSQGRENNPGRENNNRESKQLYTDLVVEVEVGGADKVQGAKVLVKSEEAGTRYEGSQTTNARGSAKLQRIPQGKVRIQVIARDCETFADFYVLTAEQQTIKVSLKKMQQ